MRIALLGLLAVGSCTAPTATGSHPVSITLEAAVVDGIATAIVTITNHAKDRIWLPTCNPIIEGYTTEGWVVAKSHGCITSVNPLEPDASMDVEFTQPTNGTYRAHGIYRRSPTGQNLTLLSEEVVW